MEWTIKCSIHQHEFTSYGGAGHINLGICREYSRHNTAVKLKTEEEVAGVYIDVLNLKPRLQNQIRCLATFDNPVYYKNKRLGYSNYYNFSTIYLGTDIDGYIKIPRGLLEEVIEKCSKSNIVFDVVDTCEYNFKAMF